MQTTAILCGICLKDISTSFDGEHSQGTDDDASYRCQECHIYYPSYKDMGLTSSSGSRTVNSATGANTLPDDDGDSDTDSEDYDSDYTPSEDSGCDSDGESGTGSFPTDEILEDKDLIDDEIAELMEEGFQSCEIRDQRFADCEPKYWDEAACAIKRGFELAKEPIALVDLCGQYRWVYKTEASGDASKILESDYGTRTATVGLQLALPEGEQDDSKAFGSFKYFSIESTFRNLAQVSGQSVWKVCESETADPQSSMHDMTITALEFSDGNGNPFVLFEWRVGFERSCSLIGKKEPVDGEWLPFSSSDRVGLGVDVNERVVELAGRLTQADKGDRKRRGKEVALGEDLERRDSEVEEGAEEN